jgi:hypothetical protein
MPAAQGGAERHAAVDRDTVDGPVLDRRPDALARVHEGLSTTGVDHIRGGTVSPPPTRPERCGRLGPLGAIFR